MGIIKNSKNITKGIFCYNFVYLKPIIKKSKKHVIKKILHIKKISRLLFLY